MSSRIGPSPSHLAATALCLGLASSNLVRPPVAGAVAAAVVIALGGVLAPGRRVLAALAWLALAGAAWGGARLDALDRSPLAGLVGTAARARVEVTAPARQGRFDQRVSSVVLAWGRLEPREPILLKLPPGRAPPQGAILEVVGRLVEPSGPKGGFDERTWLRRRGVHVVLRGDEWRIVGRRGGLGGVADRLHARIGRSIAPGLGGERAALLQGVVLGDDGGLSQNLRDRFRASGLYHLLAVSGQNVVLVAGGALLLAWVAGVPRMLAEIAALLSILGYVLAVGAQPSVIRAGIAGALGSLAWLTARAGDRWYFLLVGAIALLGWNPYTFLDAGFQLSFAAVAAIFVLVPRLQRSLEGYPLSRFLREVLAVSGACGLVTAPITWLQFHTLALLSVPANALVAPAMVPLLGLAFLSAALGPVSQGAAEAVAWLNGWFAAYLAGCARLVGGLPGAQIRSTRALLVVLAGALLFAAYSWPRWRPISSPST